MLIYIARYEVTDDDGGDLVRERFFSTEDKARAQVTTWIASKDEIFYRGTVEFYVWSLELDTQTKAHLQHVHVERTWEEYQQVLAAKTGGVVR